ncbi:hypothetical protein ASF49_12725 [Methylobacterium sp. Leaf104]|nr:hypothetical protein ASF49_12725 [Methylobacterium sp. Leaf104]
MVLGRLRMSSAWVLTIFGQTCCLTRLPFGVTSYTGCLTGQLASLGSRIRLGQSIGARADRVLPHSRVRILVRGEGLIVQLGSESMRVGCCSVLTNRFGVGGSETAFRNGDVFAPGYAISGSERLMS